MQIALGEVTVEDLVTHKCNLMNNWKFFCIGIGGLLHQLKKEYFREVFEYYLEGNGIELQQKSILTETNIKLLTEEELEN